MTVKWLAISLGCMTLFTADAQLRVQPRFTVGTAQVARTIAATFADRGIHISADQVKLPVDVLATEENPALKVSAVQPLGRLSPGHPEQASAGVKLKCKTLGACLPFYAVVTWQTPDASPVGAEVNVEKQPVTTDPPSRKAITAGAHVTLLMEGVHASIRMDVICLESAALGKQVRVASPDRKHIYQAVVVDAGLVKGSF